MKFTKALQLMATMILALGMLSACASKGSGNGAPPASGEEKDTKNGHVFYDPPITLNLARTVGPEAKFKIGQDINNNEYNDWLLEEFGVRANYAWTTPTADDAFYTKLMLSISAGEELPEFFTMPEGHVHELIASNLLMPIDGLFDKYAGEVWKNAYKEVEDCWLPYRRDGKAYAYPIADYLYEHEDVMWIREDWLRAIGMKAPATLDELRTVMGAFVKLDSSVTGVEKAYGIAAQLKGNYITWLGLNTVFGMFGTIPEMWLRDSNGEIGYSSTFPQVKEAWAELKDWMEKGYLSPEAGLVGEMDAAELFTSGRAGIAIGPTWLYSWPLQDVATNIPGAEVGVYPIPNGPDGSFVQHGNANHYQCVLFSKTAKYPQAYFEVMNYHYENMTDPAMGSQFAWGFKEGYDYVMNGDLPSYLEADMPDGIIASIFPFSGFNIPSQKVAIASFLAEGNEPITPVQIAKSIGWDEYFTTAAQIALSQKNSVLYNIFTGAPTQTMVDKMPDMMRVQEETFSNMLYGKVGIDEGFQSWLDFWNNNGGPEMTQEVRDWYKAAGGE
jgi:putative aldouronate transport system substrate-binding protein